MSRRTAIFLLLIFTLHVGGYYFISMTLRQHARSLMAQRINGDHVSATETVIFKIPFTLPYPTANSTFEKIRGEFESHGEFYKLIKQKLENDTLYVVAVRDSREKAIVNVMSQFVKASSQPSTSTALKLSNSFTNDYLSSAVVAVLSQAGWISIIPFQNHHLEPVSQISSIESPPPDHSC